MNIEASTFTASSDLSFFKTYDFKNKCVFFKEGVKIYDDDNNESYMTWKEITDISKYADLFFKLTIFNSFMLTLVVLTNFV